MSCSIDIYFVKDNDLVGAGYCNLGWVADDTKIPGAIYDAFHQAVEYFADDTDIDPDLHRFLREKRAHVFRTREDLFAYQYVVIPKCNLVIGRQLVHDLLRSYVSSEQFAEMIKEPAFKLDPDHWATIRQMSALNARRLKLDHTSDTYAEDVASLVRDVWTWRERNEHEQTFDMWTPAHQIHLRWFMNWFDGQVSMSSVLNVLRQIYEDETLQS